MSRFSSLRFPYSKKNEMPEKCPCFYHFLFIKTKIIKFFFFLTLNNAVHLRSAAGVGFHLRPFDFRLLSKMILEAFLTFVSYLFGSTK